MDIEQKDEQLWRIAKRRAGFKHAAIAYFVVNAFLIGVWYFSAGPQTYFWPKWALLGWGIGLTFQYFDAYYGNSLFSAEGEYEKLKRNQKG
jgi:hypothetical protein